MLSLAGWIPIIGPVIDGVVHIYTQMTNTQVQKETVELQSVNAVTLGFLHEIGVRIGRDMIMFPGSIYCGTIIWDRYMEIRHPELVWGVLPLTGSMEYLPYALLTFFFGSSFLYWTRK